MNNKLLPIAIIFIVLAVTAVVVVIFNPPVVAPGTSVSGFPTGLEAQVFKTIDAKTEGEWDKKVTVEGIESSKKAAQGKWYANDAWTWIAWQGTDAEWKVLVSLDGFDCNELNTVPSEYVEFFHDVTHVSEGKLYCYSH